MSKRRPNLSHSSSCHWLTRLPGATIRQRSKSPRMISSLMYSPAMIVLPAPGSSASRNRSGWRGSISPYTASIWCGSGSTWLDDKRDVRVEQVGELDPASLGSQPEQVPVTVERPRRRCGLVEVERALVGAEQQALVHLAVVGAERQVHRLRAMPLDRDHRHGTRWIHPTHPRPRDKVIKTLRPRATSLHVRHRAAS